MKYEEESFHFNQEELNGTGSKWTGMKLNQMFWTKNMKGEKSQEFLPVSFSLYKIFHLSPHKTFFCTITSQV